VIGAEAGGVVDEQVVVPVDGDAPVTVGTSRVLAHPGHGVGGGQEPQRGGVTGEAVEDLPPQGANAVRGRIHTHNDELAVNPVHSDDLGDRRGAVRLAGDRGPRRGPTQPENPRNPRPGHNLRGQLAAQQPREADVCNSAVQPALPHMAQRLSLTPTTPLRPTRRENLARGARGGATAAGAFRILRLVPQSTRKLFCRNCIAPVQLAYTPKYCLLALPFPAERRQIGREDSQG
jgi:hypothetical protein